MNRREPTYLDLVIDDLALGGRGVARHEGRVVLVEGGYPGDRVRARVYRRRRNLWEAHAEDVIEASPHREPPRCPHVGVCGGCKLQGLIYERQLHAKSRHVEEALRRIGGYADPPMQPAVAALSPYEYRNKMEFSFAADRDTGELLCGLHYAGRFDRVFDLRECHLVPSTFARSVTAARDFLRTRGVPAYDQRSHSGHARFLVVRRSEHSGEHLVNFVSTSADYALRDGFVAALRAAVPEITGIVHTQHDGRAQIAVGDRLDIWYGRAGMTERLGVLQFELSPQSFFQTNSSQAAVLYDLAVAAADPQGDETVLDLYCGTGTIGLYVAPRVHEVCGVEQQAEAVEMANENARANGIANARFECADVLAWLKRESARLEAEPVPRLVIVDPPRAGLHPDVPPAIVAAAPRRLVYVSCNPATLARDAALFRDGGYELRQITPIDMFPQTAHIECVTVFTPRGAA